MKKEIICGIYKVTSPKGRIYIGESINIYERWNTYKALNVGIKSQRKLWRSFIKYNVENHIFEIIEECTINELLCRERYWQDFYDVLNGGLNLRLTQCGDIKQVPSKDTIKKISDSQLGEKNHMFGKTHTEEARNKLSKAHTGKVLSEDTKKKMSNYWKTSNKNFIFNEGNTYANRSKVIDVTTLEIFNSLTIAAEYIGMKRSTLSKKLKGTNKNNTNLLLLEEYSKDEK